MASDLSDILKSELSNTLEQLLSNKATIEGYSEKTSEDIEYERFVQSSVKFEFKDISSAWKIFVPPVSATKFEYLMLGGMGDLKDDIDDEIADAVSEIVSNICGSFCTSVNAQGFEDIGSIKSEMQESSIQGAEGLKESKNIFEFIISLAEDKLPIYISFDDIILPFFSSITGASSPKEVVQEYKEEPVVEKHNKNVVLPDNLNLLYDIRLKLSVRLGTKVVLLKDILKWDIGEIIELEQMVHEPLEILVNGVKIGEGEAVVVEGKFGLKVKKIGNKDLYMDKIGL